MTELGERVWWWHTANHPLFGTVAELDDRPGVKPDNDPDLLYLDDDQLQRGPLPDGIYPASLGYQSDPARLSPNGAKKLIPPSTPARFDYDRRHPQKAKRVFDFGTVAHKLVLGEGDQFLVLDPAIHGLKGDGTPAASPTATAAWKSAAANARAEGMTPIHVDDYRKAMEMAQVVHQHPTAGPLLAKGEAEEWLYWTDDETGQPLRQRLDWKTRSDDRLTIVEYKTAADANPETFGRKAFDLGYFLAFAFAVMGARTLGLDEFPAYVFVAQEKEPPYLVSVCEPDAAAFQLAYRQMQQAITTYQWCTEHDEWPGYPAGINTISPPAWAFTKPTINDLLQGADQ